MTTTNDVLYDERLHVPLRWWVQATMLLATFWLAFIVALDPAVAWAATAVLAGITLLVLLGYGSARVRVEDGMFVAGRARIPVSALADPTPLDAETTRLVAGREADAQAFLLLRPYLKRSVRVMVTDPHDPAPYWLVSTRHPVELAEALASARMEPTGRG